jgi:anti-sigma factor RsiW
MNCRCFQDQLYEYVEGSLSAGAMAAAEKHLAGCPACREALQQETALARDLSRRLQQRAGQLQLPPEIRRDILAAARREPASPVFTEFILDWWRRLAAPLSVGAAALLLGVVLWLNHFPGWPKPGVETAPHAGRTLPPAVSVEFSSRVPICQFRRDGNAVIDTLSVQTVGVSVTLRPSL